MQILGRQMDYCQDLKQAQEIYKTVEHEIIMVQDKLLREPTPLWLNAHHDNPDKILITLGSAIKKYPRALVLPDIYDMPSLIKMINQGLTSAIVDDDKENDPIGDDEKNTKSEDLINPEEITLLLNNPQATIDTMVMNLDQGMLSLGKYLLLGHSADLSIQNLGMKCVEEMQKIINRTPSLGELVRLLMKNKIQYIFAHSLLAAHVSQFLIGRMSWGAKGQAEKLTFAFFFHDIWLAPLLSKYPDIQHEDELLFNDEIDEKEKNILLQHARMAHDLVLTIPNMPLGAETIILQHHGSRTGHDFASDFADHLTPLAKVALIAHAFAEDYVDRIKANPKDKVKVEEILNELKLRFSRPTYKKILAPLNQLPL
jgi:hypothetical protein